MANIKVSQLPAASTPLTGTELAMVVQGGLSKQTAVSTFGAAISYTPAGTGAVTTTVQAKLRQTVSFKDFGCTGNGTTDDTAAFQLAVNYASSAGCTLTGDSTDTYRLTGSVTSSGALRIRGSFTIKQGVGGGIQVEPSRTVSTSVSAITTTQYPASTGLSSVPTLTVSSATGLSVGDICHLRSTNTYSYDGTVKKGETVEIAAISGTTVYLVGSLVNTYTTSITLEKLNSAVVDIDGPIFTYDGDPSVPTSITRLCALMLTGCVKPRVRATFQDDLTSGLLLYTCWKSEIDVTAKNLRVNYGYGMYGYGVVSYGSCGYGRIKVNGYKTGHLYTNGVWAGGTSIRDGNVVGDYIYSSVSTGSLMASFDTHAGAVGTRFDGCFATYNTTDAGQPNYSTCYGFQDRGLNTQFIGCGTTNTYASFYFGTTSVDYGGVVNTTKIQGGVFSNTGSTGTFNGVAAQTSTDTITFQVTNATLDNMTWNNYGSTTAVLDMKFCTFQGNGSYGWNQSDSEGQINYTMCEFNKILTVRTGKNCVVRMLKCNRISTHSNAEPIIVKVGSTLTLDGYYADAPSWGAGGLVKCGDGSASTSSTVTISNASPAVITWSGHGLRNNTAVQFTTTGGLPSGLQTGVTYYVINATSTTFNVTDSLGGAAINTTTAGSGTQTCSTTIALNSGTMSAAMGFEYYPITTDGVVTTSVIDIKQRPLRPQKGATGSRPSLKTWDVGATYLDTTLAANGKPITWTGTIWVDSAGTSV